MEIYLRDKYTAREEEENKIQVKLGLLRGSPFPLALSTREGY